MFAWLKKNILYLAFLQALLATLGSLYFSEIKHYTPCILCWYQRIAMYPLVLILAAGIIERNKRLAIYVLPLSIIGWLIALYHNLLYYQILPQSLLPCEAGVSCTTRYFAWFGFITIPLLSFIAFSVINSSLIYFHLRERKAK